MVVEIRQRAAAGETHGSICRRFGVTIGTIGRIVRKETYQRVALIVDEPLDEQRSEAELLRRLGMQLPDDASTATLDRMLGEARALREKETKVDSMLNELTGDSK